jgi:predicted transcriptional regulator
MNSVMTRSNYPHLPQVEDLLRMIEQWCKSTGVTRADLARLLEVDRSAITHTFQRQRKLDYEESVQILDYLLNRLSPLPEETIKLLCIRPRELKRIQSSDTVAKAASKLMEDDFTQIPVFGGDKYLGLATDRMIIERLLDPNETRFEGRWIDRLRKMTIKEADIIETSSIYPLDSSITSVAQALKQFYAVMLSDNDQPRSIVTRWDYLKLLVQDKA